MLNKSKLKQAR